MMDGRVVGIHMTTVINLPLQKLPPNLQKLKLLPALQHLHQHQVELVHKHQVVVIHHLHQPVVVQRQMFITQLQVIVTTLQVAKTIQLHHVP